MANAAAAAVTNHLPHHLKSDCAVSIYTSTTMSFLRRAVIAFQGSRIAITSCTSAVARPPAAASASAFLPRARFFSTAEAKKPETEAETGTKVGSGLGVFGMLGRLVYLIARLIARQGCGGAEEGGGYCCSRAGCREAGVGQQGSEGARAARAGRGREYADEVLPHHTSATPPTLQTLARLQTANTFRFQPRSPAPPFFMCFAAGRSATLPMRALSGSRSSRRACSKCTVPRVVQMPFIDAELCIYRPFIFAIAKAANCCSC